MRHATPLPGSFYASTKNLTENLADVSFPRWVVTQFRKFIVRGYPQTMVLAAGITQPRTIVHAWHPNTNAVLTRTQACVRGAGNMDRTAWPGRHRFVGSAPSRRTGRALVHLFCVAVSYCTGASGRTNSMTVTSGGASRRMGGPQVPDPRLV